MKSLRDFNIDFMGVRRQAIGLSVAAVLLSFASLAYQGLNFGLDFTGGTLVELTFPTPAAPDQVRSTLEEGGFVNGIVQNFGTERDVLIRMPPQEGREAATIGNAVFQALEAQFPGVELRRSEFVGPAVGEELRETGGLAMIAALVSVLIYIMFRFTGKFAIGGVVALTHDAIVTLGAFSLFQWTFDLTGLAAVLAIIGYSINDTIVIFDRIRENFRAMRRSTPAETINVSINQTLDRTISTSFTVFLVLFALALYGGDVVHSFSLALIVGVVAGTYSSVYVAANLLVVLGMTREDLLTPEKEKEQNVP
jgi:preprotein translocase subunit SecF